MKKIIDMYHVEKTDIDVTIPLSFGIDTESAELQWPMTLYIYQDDSYAKENEKALLMGIDHHGTLQKKEIPIRSLIKGESCFIVEDSNKYLKIKGG